MKPFLAIDTSTEYVVCAIALPDGSSKSVLKHSPQAHQEAAFGVIQELLSQTGLKTSSFKSIAVGVGPGSFTGIRIGVTIAKTMAHALELPLVSVDSLKMRALGAYLEHMGELKNASEKKVIVLSDAKKNEIYAAIYRILTPEGSQVQIDTVWPPSLLKTDHAEKFVESVPLGQRIVTGDALVAKSATGGETGKCLSESLVICAEQQIRSGNILSWIEVEPIYLRASYAEEAKGKNASFKTAHKKNGLS